MRSTRATGGELKVGASSTNRLDFQLELSYPPPPPA
jgi:hypothetical protein